MPCERKDAVEEALELDKEIGTERATILRAIRVLTYEHQDDPDWPGATVAEIAEKAGKSNAWARTQAEWLAAAGYVIKSVRRDVPFRPPKVYRAA